MLQGVEDDVPGGQLQFLRVDDFHREQFLCVLPLRQEHCSEHPAPQLFSFTIPFAVCVVIEINQQ